MQSFNEFQVAALADGYDEVLERTWSANEKVDIHSHPFALRAMLVKGEMWLSVGKETLHLLPGNTFELTKSALHSEQYGVDGATYWVARRQ